MAASVSNAGFWRKVSAAARSAFVDQVLQRDHHAQPDEGTRRQDRQQDPGIGVTQAELPTARRSAEHQVGIGEQGALADQLARGAQGHQCQREAGTDQYQQGQQYFQRRRHGITR